MTSLLQKDYFPCHDTKIVCIGSGMKRHTMQGHGMPCPCIVQITHAEGVIKNYRLYVCAKSHTEDAMIASTQIRSSQFIPVARVMTAGAPQINTEKIMRAIQNTNTTMLA